MTPLASVAMLEKFALLKIALCKRARLEQRFGLFAFGDVLHRGPHSDDSSVRVLQQLIVELHRQERTVLPPKRSLDTARGAESRRSFSEKAVRASSPSSMNSQP